MGLLSANSIDSVCRLATLVEKSMGVVEINKRENNLLFLAVPISCHAEKRAHV